MTTPILLASSLLAAVLVAALVREVRLRRALQRLLSRLLTAWRTRSNEDITATRSHLGDTRSADADRM